MLTIREDQLQHLARVASFGFARRSLRHLREVFPDIWSSCTDGEGLEVIELAVERASTLGFVNELGVLRFLEVMSLVGLDLGEHSRHVDALALLHDEVDAGAWESRRELIVALCEPVDDGEQS